MSKGVWILYNELEIAYMEADEEFKRTADVAFVNPTKENMDAFFAAEHDREKKRRDWIYRKNEDS